MPGNQTFSRVDLEPTPPDIPDRINFRRPTDARPESKTVRTVRERIEDDLEALKAACVLNCGESMLRIDDLHAIASSLTKPMENEAQERDICSLANSQLTTLESKIARIASDFNRDQHEKIGRQILPVAIIVTLVGVGLHILEPNISKYLATLTSDNPLLKEIGNVLASVVVMLGGAFAGVWLDEHLSYKSIKKTGTRKLDVDSILNIRPGSVRKRLIGPVGLVFVIMCLLYTDFLQFNLMSVDLVDYAKSKNYFVTFAIGFLLSVSEIKIMNSIRDKFSKSSKVEVSSD